MIKRSLGERLLELGRKRKMSENDRIAEEFLNAAVLIDDQLTWENPLIPDADIIEPNEFDPLPSVNDRKLPAAAADSKINAEQIVDSFSDLGMICSTFRWTSSSTNFPNSTDRSDLLILDWKLSPTDENGETARLFLEDRIKKDLNGKRRLRYITIYTDNKSDRVFAALMEDFDKIKDIKAVAETGAININVKNGPHLWRILYLNKKKTPEPEVAKHIVDDFEQFMNGFLPKIVMASVADIRNNTYKYLYRFNSQLDKAALSHFFALRSSSSVFTTAIDNFQEYLINLVVSDIANSIQSSESVAHLSSEQAIKNYLNDCGDAKFGILDKDFVKVSSHLSNFVSGKDRSKFMAGIRRTFRLKNDRETNRAINTASYPLRLEVPDNSNEEIASIDLYNSSPRQIDGRIQLKAGTIIQRKRDKKDNRPGNNEYLICVQPLCDSIRLDGKSSFPFLRLERNKKFFNFVVKEPNKYAYLKCEAKPMKLFSTNFEADAITLDVRTNESGSYLDLDGVKFQWVAELKEIFAQEILNQLASSSSRVGSNKLEWLRTKAR